MAPVSIPGEILRRMSRKIRYFVIDNRDSGEDRELPNRGQSSSCRRTGELGPRLATVPAGELGSGQRSKDGSRCTR